jgi:hypothetical protein
MRRLNKNLAAKFIHAQSFSMHLRERLFAYSELAITLSRNTAFFMHCVYFTKKLDALMQVCIL